MVVLRDFPEIAVVSFQGFPRYSALFGLGSGKKTPAEEVSLFVVPFLL